MAPGLDIVVPVPTCARDDVQRMVVDTCTRPIAATTYGERAFAYAIPTIWNSLPNDLKDINLSLSTFKRDLKTFFL